MRVWPGGPSTLGATWDGEGTNFAIFAEHWIFAATEAELREPGDFVTVEVGRSSVIVVLSLLFPCPTGLDLP